MDLVVAPFERPGVQKGGIFVSSVGGEGDESD